MLVLRILLPLAALFLLGLGVAYLVTRDRGYLRLAGRTLLVLLLLGAALALFYVFGRILLVL